MSEQISLCVFCGSSVGVDPAHAAAARALGRLMVANDIRLVFGGGRVGLMGVLADEVLMAGGSVTGVIPDFLMRAELVHPNVSDIIQVDSMHARKQRMFELADAFAALPGGIGTLDETVEVITWKQLRLHDKPILLVDNEGYWQPFLGLLGHVVASGFADSSLTDLVTLVPSVAAVPDVLGGLAPGAAAVAADRL